MTEAIAFEVIVSLLERIATALERLAADPGTDDDADEFESDSTPRFEGGYWTDPNDPTA